MDKDVKLIWSNSGDWVILYIDNEFVYEGHNLDSRDLMFYLGVRFQERSADSNSEIFKSNSIKITQEEFDGLTRS